MRKQIISILTAFCLLLAAMPAAAALPGVTAESFSDLKTALEGGKNVFLPDGAEILVSSKIVAAGEPTIEGTGIIKRHPSYEGTLIEVGSGSTLTLQAALDGNRSEMSVDVLSPAVLVQNAGTFILDADGSIRNCKMYASEGSAVHLNDGAVFTMTGGVIEGNEGEGLGTVYVAPSASFTLESGVIQNNKTAVAEAYGGAGIFNQGVFAMHGGTIAANSTAQFGGALYNAAGGIALLNGGDITDSNTSVIGDVVFAGSQFDAAGKVCLSGEIQIQGPIIFDSGECLTLQGPLKNPVTVKPTYYANNMDIVRGENYQLAKADLERIAILSPQGRQWYSALDEETNRIYLTSERPVQAFDLTAQIVSQTSTFVETYNNRFANQTLTQVDDSVFYVDVCALEDAGDSLTLGQTVYPADTAYRLSIGNNGFTQVPVWKVAAGRLLVALPWLCAEAAGSGSVQLETGGFFANVTVYTTPSDQQLSITGVGVLGTQTGYVNEAVVSGENEVTHTFGHGKNYVGIKLSAGGEDITDPSTVIFRKTSSGAMALVTPENGYTYTLYPEYSVNPVEKDKEFIKDYTLVVPGKGAIQIKFLFHAVALNTDIDLTAQIVSQTSSFVETYNNRFANQTLTQVDDSVFYVDVCALEDAGDSLTLGQTAYPADTAYRLSIGNNGFTQVPVWKVAEGRLLVALPWLCAEAAGSGSVQLETGGFSGKVIVYATPSDQQLSITGVGVLGTQTGYVNEAVVSGENEVTHTFGHGKNYVGIKLSAGGEDITDPSTVIFRKTSSGAMALVTPENGYTYTLYPAYSTEPVSQTETTYKDYTLVVPGKGAIEIRFIFHATAPDTEIDLTAQIQTQTEAFVSAYYNQFANQTLTQVDETIYYVDVCEMELPDEGLTLGDTVYSQDAVYKLSIGKNGFIELPVWKVTDGRLKIALPWLCAEAAGSGKVQVALGSQSEEVIVYSTPSDQPLSLTAAGVLGTQEGYVNEAAVSGENEVTHTFGHGKNYVGVKLSMNGEEITDPSTVIFRKAPDGSMGLVTPESGYTYTLYPDYSVNPVEKDKEFIKDYTLVVPGKGAIQIKFLFHAVALNTDIDLTAQIVSQTSTFVETYNNRFANQTLTQVDDSVFYVDVCALEDAGDSLTLGQTAYPVDTAYRLSIGNNGFTQVPVWKVAEGRLLVALPWLCAEAAGSGSVQLETGGFSGKVIVYATPSDQQLSITGVGVLGTQTGYVNEAVVSGENEVTHTFGHGKNYVGIKLSAGGEDITDPSTVIFRKTSSGAMALVTPENGYTYTLYPAYSTEPVSQTETTYKDYTLVVPGKGAVEIHFIFHAQMLDAAEYTVTFLSDGEPVGQQKIKSGAVAVRPDDPAKEGYVFLGWMAGDQYYDFSAPVSQDLVLHAHWKKETEEKIQHTVMFESDGEPVGAVMVEDGQVLTKPEDPAKEGYVFKGWYDSQAPYDFTQPVTTDLTLTARWEKYVPVVAEITSDKILSTHNTVLQLDQETKTIYATYESDAYTTLNFNVSLADGEHLSASGPDAKILYDTYYSITLPSQFEQYGISITSKDGIVTSYNVVIEDKTYVPPCVTGDKIISSHNSEVRVDTEANIIYATYESLDYTTINFRLKLGKGESLAAQGEGASILYDSYYSITGPKESGNYQLIISNTKGLSQLYQIVIEDNARTLPAITEDKIISVHNTDVAIDQAQKVITASYLDTDKISINFRIKLEKGESLSAAGGEIVGSSYYQILYPRDGMVYGITITNEKGAVTYQVNVTGLPQEHPEITSEKIRSTHNTVLTVEPETDTIYATYEDASYSTINFQVDLGEGELLSASGRNAQMIGNSYFSITYPSPQESYSVTITGRFGTARTYRVVITKVDQTPPQITQSMIGAAHNSVVTVLEDGTIGMTYENEAFTTINFHLLLNAGEKMTASGEGAAILYGSYFRILNPSPDKEYAVTITNGAGVSTTYPVIVR